MMMSFAFFITVVGNRLPGMIGLLYVTFWIVLKLAYSFLLFFFSICGRISAVGKYVIVMLFSVIYTVFIAGNRHKLTISDVTNGGKSNV